MINRKPRLDGWEKRLEAVIEKHMSLPSEFGLSDCYIIPDDAVEALIGERMYEDARGYKTPAGAQKKLLQHGFNNVKEAFAARFRPVHPAKAVRGDIGVVLRDGEYSGGVFTSIGFMTRTDDGVIFLPPSEVKNAFKVE